ncbi:adenosine kinase [Varunaivibrio sulfuroxidans]|uniref:Sugar/nucleoside kinase (Ribokinase family) n=1 Tax=Varunaivibrio sulfuroxidans TaxID=1773489 RepID=A0A4R3JFK1_9PROT|nr:adenosine kinase [Varunaivibrio sulfuroxidans]TCS64919.1 sugar/nucleoside kinase (ribokinase family) [Varunaivibrio sulfuroxidans]WES29787.1 adenosine kinase [Varunaivibrio sulfuroxidans]
MTQTRFDVAGIGNAIVDVLAHADDAFIGKHGLNKGSMALVDDVRAEALYQDMGPGIECSGGSAANTIAGLALLGARAAFIGKVSDDQLGRVFAHDITSAGVHFATAPSKDGAPTARSMIVVTPDAERTMNTYLGACVDLNADDVDPDVIAAAKVTYMEGYLWDKDTAKEAFVKAAKIAHEAGRMVSLSLSDPFCVDRHRDSFLALVENHVDILFANEDEIMSLYRTVTFDDALQKARGHCKIAALTRSEKGSIVVSGEELHVVDAESVAKVMDTTGAGDAYAAGFLYGLTNGHGDDLALCARIGGICAGDVIAQFGARPADNLKDRLNTILGVA